MGTTGHRIQNKLLSATSVVCIRCRKAGIGPQENLCCTQAFLPPHNTRYMYILSTTMYIQCADFYSFVMLINMINSYYITVHQMFGVLAQLGYMQLKILF